MEATGLLIQQEERTPLTMHESVLRHLICVPMTSALTRWASRASTRQQPKLLALLFALGSNGSAWEGGEGPWWHPSKLVPCASKLWSRCRDLCGPWVLTDASVRVIFASWRFDSSVFASILHCFQDSFSNSQGQGSAGVAEQTADLNNEDKTYPILCPQCEMTYNDSRFHHLFIAVGKVCK